MRLVVISELARHALNAPSEIPAARAPKALYGLRPFPKRGGIVTNDTSVSIDAVMRAEKKHLLTL